MAGMADGKMRALEGMLHDAAGRLSPAHVAALVAHPDAVRSALAVAADALSAKHGERVETIGAGAPLLVGAEESDERLSARGVDGAPETLLTSDELAARAGLKTRQSVHDWLKKGKIVGWRGRQARLRLPGGSVR